MTAADRVVAVLARGPLTYEAIRERLAASFCERYIRMTLSTLRHKGVVEIDALEMTQPVWRLADRQEDR